ncbi:MAG TPA: DMT family transporter [Burkholderiales bacterium]
MPEPRPPTAAAGAPAHAYAVLGAGVLIVSTAAILIRYAHAQGVPSLSIAAWRLTLAALWLAPVAWLRAGAELRALKRGQWLLALASGAFLGVHFATWIASLEYTTVASSVALVTTNPIWLALFAWTFLHERLSPRLLFAIGLALAGSAAMFMADRDSGLAARPMFGNALALTGSLAICGYLLIGRKLRASMNLLPYISIVYASAAVCLMAAALTAGARLAGFPLMAWVLLAALALGPQLLGHSAVNYALRFFPATVIAVAVLGEPIGSSALAWLVFGESIGPVKFVGMALLLAGIFLAATNRARGKPAATSSGRP